MICSDVYFKGLLSQYIPKSPLVNRHRLGVDYDPEQIASSAQKRLGFKAHYEVLHYSLNPLALLT